jgi:hypothetical protein
LDKLDSSIASSAGERDETLLKSVVWESLEIAFKQKQSRE